MLFAPAREIARHPFVGHSVVRLARQAHASDDGTERHHQFDTGAGGSQQMAQPRHFHGNRMPELGLVQLRHGARLVDSGAMQNGGDRTQHALHPINSGGDRRPIGHIRPNVIVADPLRAHALQIRVSFRRRRAEDRQPRAADAGGLDGALRANPFGASSREQNIMRSQRQWFSLVTDR